MSAAACVSSDVRVPRARMKLGKEHTLQSLGEQLDSIRAALAIQSGAPGPTTIPDLGAIDARLQAIEATLVDANKTAGRGSAASEATAPAPQPAALRAIGERLQAVEAALVESRSALARLEQGQARSSSALPPPSSLPPPAVESPRSPRSSVLPTFSLFKKGPLQV